MPIWWLYGVYKVAIWLIHTSFVSPSYILRRDQDTPPVASGWLSPRLGNQPPSRDMMELFLCFRQGRSFLMTSSASSDWLSLTQAAALLGVHPSTLRLWSDKGVLPVHRTQGGHRRYKRSEVELWAQTARNQQAIEPIGVIQVAFRNIRIQIAEGALEAQTWYQKLDQEARAQYRQSSRTLFQSLMNYLASESEEAISEAHSIGYEYASRAHRFGLSSADAARAFLFFRDVLLQSVIQAYQEANVPSGQAWGEILRKVNAFTDLVLLHLLETFESLS